MEKKLICDIQLEDTPTVPKQKSNKKYIKKVKNEPKPLIKDIVFGSIVLSFD